MDWMNAITAVTVNDSSYRNGSLSWTYDTDLWEVGSTTGAYGSYTALRIGNPSSYPATVKISATDYEDIVIKVEKDRSKYPYVYTATIESNGSGESPDTPSAESYAITVGTSENGTVTADKETAKAGETVTLSVAASGGYELETLTVTGSTGSEVVETTKTTDGTYTFTMPGEKVTVTATFKKYVPGQITVSNVNLSQDFFGQKWYFTFDIDGYVERITAFKVNDTEWTENTLAPSRGGQYYPNTVDNRIEVAVKNFSSGSGPEVLKSGDSIIISATGYSDLALKFIIDTNGKASLVADDGKGDPYKLHVKIDGSFEAAIVGQKDYDGVSGASSGGASSNKNSAVTVYGALVEKGSEVQDSAWETLNHQSNIRLNGKKCKVNIVPDTKKGTNENSDSGMEGVYLTLSSDLTLDGTPKDAGNYLISISVEDDQGRTAVSNTLPFVIYTGEETLADQIKKNLKQYQSGLYAWDIMEPWAIKNFGSNVDGETESVRVPKDLEVWFGSHQSGTYGYLGYDIPWDQVKAGNIPQTLYIPNGCSLTLTNMEILSSVRIVVEHGGKLTLSDSVVQGIIDVQGGGTFSMNYDAFNRVFTTGASVCGQIRLADGAILENAAIYSHTNYLANGDKTDRSNDDPVVQTTGSVTVKGQVYIKGDEAGSTGKGQTALGVKNGTITLADNAVLATYGGGGPLDAEGGNALKLEKGTVTGNGQLIAIGGDVLWGKGGTAVAGSGAISTKSALLQGATSRETKKAEPGKAADKGVWVNSPNRYVKDGTCIDKADDPLADLYWRANGVEATPKAETLTKYKELTNMSDNEKTEIDKNPGNGSSAGASSSSGSHKHKHSSSDNSAATTSVQAAATSFAEAVSGTAAATNTKTTTTLANLQAIAAAENAKNAEAVSGVDEETEDAGSVTVSENAASYDTDSETEVAEEDNASDAQGQEKGSIPVVPIVGLLVVAGGLLIFFAGRKKQK